MYDPIVWGPTFWSVFLLAADRLATGDFHTLSALFGHLLPCVHCRTSYAEYLARLAPELSVRDRESALLYVWSVKDLVSEKLGQPALPRSKLTARVCALTQYAGANDVLDVLGLAALSVGAGEEERRRAFFEAAPLLCRLCAEVDEGPRVAPDAASEPAAHALACRNALQRARGLRPWTLEGMRRQYEHARGAEAAAAAAPSRRRRPRGADAHHEPRGARRRRAAP